MLLYDKYFKIVLLSCAISWPIGYIVMNKWLDKFPYKIEIGLSPFVAAAALAILISFVSILIQISRSTSRRPADVLRVE
jgi:putative ABC transport system permease protein